MAWTFSGRLLSGRHIACTGTCSTVIGLKKTVAAKLQVPHRRLQLALEDGSDLDLPSGGAHTIAAMSAHSTVSVMLRAEAESSSGDSESSDDSTRNMCQRRSKFARAQDSRAIAAQLGAPDHDPTPKNENVGEWLQSVDAWGVANKRRRAEKKAGKGLQKLAVSRCLGCVPSEELGYDEEWLADSRPTLFVCSDCRRSWTRASTKE